MSSVAAGEGQGAAGDKAVADLKRQLDELKAEAERLKGANADLAKKAKDADELFSSEGYLEYLESKSRGSRPADADEEVDLDTLSGKALHSKIVGELGEQLKELRGQLTSMATDFAKQQRVMSTRMGFELAKVRNPDLGERIKDKAFQQKFVAMAKENPSWDPERLYRQIKLEELEAKVAQDEKNRASANAEREAFSEKGGIPPSLTDGKAMTADEAGDKAWELVMGQESPEV